MGEAHLEGTTMTMAEETRCLLLGIIIAQVLQLQGIHTMCHPETHMAPLPLVIHMRQPVVIRMQHLGTLTRTPGTHMLQHQGIRMLLILMLPPLETPMVGILMQPQPETMMLTPRMGRDVLPRLPRLMIGVLLTPMQVMQAATPTLLRLLQIPRLAMALLPDDTKMRQFKVALCYTSDAKRRDHIATEFSRCAMALATVRTILQTKILRLMKSILSVEH